MVKKRELVVEKWLHVMEKDLVRLESVGIDRFVDEHVAAGHDMDAVVFEMTMARQWKDGGMQVYDFDPDFAKSILSEKWAELLPECIQFRPHECFYMKLPCDSTSEGVVVLVFPVENIVNFEEELFPNFREEPGVYFGGVLGSGGRAIVNTGDECLCLCQFPIPKEIGLMFDETPLDLYPANLVVNGVAYICSANADIFRAYEPIKEVKRNKAKKRSRATWHDVGYRIGSELRAYERVRYERQPHQGGTVRPHMRRAHWHHYWTGPRNGERRLVLKWIAPIMVGTGIKSATSHRVIGG